jgi:hypothetical protein
LAHPEPQEAVDLVQHLRLLGQLCTTPEVVVGVEILEVHQLLVAAVLVVAIMFLEFLEKLTLVVVEVVAAVVVVAHLSAVQAVPVSLSFSYPQHRVLKHSPSTVQVQS